MMRSSAPQQNHTVELCSQLPATPSPWRSKSPATHCGRLSTRSSSFSRGPYPGSAVSGFAWPFTGLIPHIEGRHRDAGCQILSCNLINKWPHEVARVAILVDKHRDRRVIFGNLHDKLSSVSEATLALRSVFPGMHPIGWSTPVCILRSVARPDPVGANIVEVATAMTPNGVAQRHPSA